jgi:hypothetical protein
MLKEIVKLTEKALRDFNGAVAERKTINVADGASVAKATGADAKRGRE